MKNSLFVGLLIVAAASGCLDSGSSGSRKSSSSDIAKIIAAKDIVRTYVANYPDTLDFHEWSYSPKVSGNTVRLKFSCKNAFGVQETHVMNIKVK